MIKYYITKGNKLVFDINKQRLVNTILFTMPQYKDYEVLETERPIKDFQFADTDDYQEQKAKEERERLDKLSMTRGDVFEALILAKGLNKAQLRAMIEGYNTDETTKALYLNRFDEALEFYRGYPIFDLLGEQIGVTPQMWDRFFESKEWEELVNVEEVEIPPTGASDISSNSPAVNEEIESEDTNIAG